MRGARRLFSERRRLRWIIPADAGSTPSRPYTSCPSEDHPRGCGEHNTGTKNKRPVRGSSPRMRGAPPVHILLQQPKRIIPADAGSTQRHYQRQDRAWDHPRGCGEHIVCPKGPQHFPGSSPRMRGARPIIVCPERRDRIIPADAGSTTEQFSRNFAKKDHPRGCGEHRHYRCLEWAWRGSSPRMRGAPCLTVRIYPWPGIIPADAGSTRPNSLSADAVRDHPRGCGEHNNCNGRA